MWSEVFQILNVNNFQPRSMYTTKLFFGINGKTKYFYDNERPEKFVLVKSALQRALKDFLERDNRLPFLSTHRKKAAGIANN